jgi:uncharacterized membrane protein
MRRKDIVFLGAVLVPGIFFRIFRLGTIFFSGDEPLYQIRMSYQSVPFLLNNSSSPLFSFLVHFLLPLGSLEFMSRLISSLSGILTVLAVYALGRTLFSEKEGRLAALFAAFSPLLIFYSEHSRAYALFALLSLLSLYYFYRAARDGRTRDWAFYAVLAALAAFTHIIAFLVLPAFALYIGGLWLAGRLRQKKDGAANPRTRTVKLFLIWTAGSILLSALLHLPCGWVRTLFIGSLQRGLGRPPDVAPVSVSFIREVMSVLLSPSSSFLFIVLLAALALGFFSSLKKYSGEAALCGLYLVLPWAIVLAGKPRETTVFALYRYFIFLLPPLLVLVSRGIVAVGSWADRIVFRTRKPFSQKTVVVVLALAITAGLLFNLKGQYVGYWRQGSFKLAEEARVYLGAHARRDGLLYLDVYPQSFLTLMLNPLSKDLKPDEIVYAAREEYVRPSESGDYMIHVLGWYYFEDYVASRNVELWAITARTPGKSERLHAALGGVPDVELVELENNILLHFKKDGGSLADRMTRLADLLVALPEQDPVIRRTRHLFAARAFLMTREAADGIRELRAFSAIHVDHSRALAQSASIVDRLFEKIWGLNSQKLLSIYEGKALTEIQHLVFRQANMLFEERRLPEAAAVYEEVSKLGPDYDNKLVDRWASLAEDFEKAGDETRALDAYRNAVQLDPRRNDIFFLLGRIQWRAGRRTEAEESYGRALGGRRVPESVIKRFSEEPACVVVWCQGSRSQMLFSANQATSFQGKIESPSPLGAFRSLNFSPDDVLKAAGRKAEFALKASEGKVKMLSFSARGGGHWILDVRINGRRNSQNIIVLDDIR